MSLDRAIEKLEAARLILYGQSFDELKDHAEKESPGAPWAYLVGVLKVNLEAASFLLGDTAQILVNLEAEQT